MEPPRCRTLIWPVTSPGWRRGQVTVEASYTGLFSGDTRYTDLLYKTLSVGLILCPARLNPPTLNMSFTDWPQKVWSASPWLLLGSHIQMLELSTGLSQCLEKKKEIIFKYLNACLAQCCNKLWIVKHFPVRRFYVEGTFEQGDREGHSRVKFRKVPMTTLSDVPHRAIQGN